MPKIQDPVIEEIEEITEIIYEDQEVLDEEHIIIEEQHIEIIEPIKHNKRANHFYNCNHCEMKFKTPKALSNHLKNEHDPKNAFLCPYSPNCINRFADQKKLKIHINRHEAEMSLRDDGNYYCRTCEKFCATKDLLIAHVATHIQSYCCDFCGKTFTKFEFMENHVIQHIFGRTQKEHKKVICEQCCQWVQRDRMKRHIYQFHSDKKDFKCSECGKEFKYSNSLRDHLDIHKNNPRYNCEFCGKKFFNHTNFKNHTLRHTDPDRFKCNICGERYANSKSLSNHMKRVHEEMKKKLQCPYSNCDKSYSVDTALKSHIRRVHENNKNVKNKIFN
jgi:KRAB domain-containing zinc finger protein